MPDDHQALNAAIHGRGIALTPRHLLEDDIEAGNIVYANNQPVSLSTGGHYFVSPTGVRPSSILDAVRDWLVEITGTRKLLLRRCDERYKPVSMTA